MEMNDIRAQSHVMAVNTASPVKVSNATWIGLFLSLFAMVVIRHAFVLFVPEITVAAAILKETLIWISAVALLVIVGRGEHLSFRSIGLGTSRWWVAILWGLVIAVVSAAIVEELAYITGYGHGPGSAAFEKLPLWLITLIVFRAGVVEELFTAATPSNVCRWLVSDVPGRSHFRWLFFRSVIGQEVRLIF